MPYTLTELKKQFDPAARERIGRTLSRISRQKIKDPQLLIRLHEDLSFMLAYPQSKAILAQVIKLLRSFPMRILYLESIGADMSAFEDPGISGITGLPVTIMSGYKFSEWLAELHGNKAGIDWIGYGEDAAIATVLPEIIPLFDEEAMVEPHVVFKEYINAALSRKESDLTWLIRNISHLQKSEKEKAGLYESLKLFVRFEPSFSKSRTGLRLPGKIFYHTQPLIRRSEVNLSATKAGKLKIQKLVRNDAGKILDTIRLASVVRYRELHGFIWADTGSFYKVEPGRGVVIYINESLPGHRLPLRAYHSGFVFKNGVPVGYVEGISIFDKMEIGFNHYYTFRDGETAWLFSQLVQVFREHLGIKVFSIDPYQIGHENEEGILSGAFWFYRKLGFQPLQDKVTSIVINEEEKILRDKNYRTSPAILRRIAKSHLIYSDDPVLAGQWKKFHIRNILLKIQKFAATGFSKGTVPVKTKIEKQVGTFLGIEPTKLNPVEKAVFGNYALLLALLLGFSGWSTAEKMQIKKMIHSKGRGSEKQYLKLMQSFPRLKLLMVATGSNH